MGSKPNVTFLVAPCLAVSAALFFLGTGLAPLWPLAWLAPIPVLWASSRLTARQAFFVAAAAYALGGLNEWSYARSVLATWIVASILVFSACMFAVGVLLFRVAIVRGKIWQAALAFPAFWVSVEFAVATVSVHSTFGNIAYSQMNFLPVLQIASVTGIWGISFTIFLFASTVAAVLVPGPRSVKLPLLIGSAAVITAVFVFGAWRLASTPNSPTIKVALIASDSPEDLNPQTPAETQQIFLRYAEHIKLLAGQGIQLFVLPETVGPVDDASQQEFDDFFGKLAKEAEAYIEIGVARITPSGASNQERVYSPQGELVATYDKHHLLPPGENRFTPGTKRAVFSGISGKWGLEICKDMDFPRLSRQYSDDGIALLIVPASDFVDDGWLHGRMAILRGVESGFSIARSAKLGILTDTDDRGRVLAARNTIGSSFPSVVANVPVRHDATLYARFGNWFAWGCVALLLLTIVSGRKYAAKAE
ncbi:MAG TPA: nitrilase-related carbon-nitrogen hydrolase [Verrucomicrobiae bacterium]|nr:nitrilase-related carbon-nitrogen hydrolase [Verrucomicrobiae bacterium]